MPIQCAWIEEEGTDKYGVEENALASECSRRGLPVHPFTRKKLYRRQLSLDRSCLVAGSMSVVLSALKQLKVAPPVPNDYPESLRGYLHRHIWQTTVIQLQIDVLENGRLPVFVKPADRFKGFTGGLLESHNDFYRLGSISRKAHIWCSEKVHWLSEYRVYVVHSKIVGVDCYDGDSSRKSDMTVVTRALADLEAAGESHAGYAIDFGVLSDGTTALIELNEGFALGLYQLDAVSYTNLIWARWEELMTENQPI